MTEALARYVAEHRGPCLEEVLQGAPDLAPLSAALHPEPFGAFRLVHVAFENLPKALHIASWAASHSRTCNLRSVLDGEWQSNTAVVQRGIAGRLHSHPLHPDATA